MTDSTELTVDDWRSPRRAGVVTHRVLHRGEWPPAASGQTFTVVNPATGDLLTEVAAGDAEDIDTAVAAAASAFGAWSACRRPPAGNCCAGSPT